MDEAKYEFCTNDLDKLEVVDEDVNNTTPVKTQRDRMFEQVYAKQTMNNFVRSKMSRR